MNHRNSIFPKVGFCGLSVFLSLIFAFTPLAAQKKAVESSKKAEPKVAEMVWPLPPEKPRVKYLGAIASNEDVEPPKKKGWLKKLINEEEARNVMAMTRPSAIAVDSKGRIYVVDTLKASVFIFDLQTKKMNLLGTQGRGRLIIPYGIAIDKNDNVYVSDTKLKRVMVYNPAGELIGAVSRIGNETLINPAGLAIDDMRNRLFIVDSQGHKVFACELNQLDNGVAFGKRGEAEGTFNFPTAVAIDKQGRVYVTDTLNFCIKIFDKDFKFIKRIGEHGTGYGMFDRPKGIALDSEGNIYVVDASFSNFQIFNSEGQLLLFVGGYGAEPGFFRLPTGVFIDKSDRIYVADSINRRIQMFQFLGGK
ncbi:MAG: SBBP repeat-containing protein [Acidobacteriota bacterium]